MPRRAALLSMASRGTKLPPRSPILEKLRLARKGPARNGTLKCCRLQPSGHWIDGTSMNPLRTTVVMKTDISGSTSRFRGLLAADLQLLLGDHRDFLARHAAEHNGQIIKAAGDGYWLEFASVTDAAK